MKKYNVYICYIVTFLTVIISVIFCCYVSSNRDETVFEFSRYSTGGSCYYALKEDGSFIWVYGAGHLGHWTYGSYFDNIREKGIVRISEPDKENLYYHMKEITKHYKPLKSSDIIHINGDEVTVKCNGKYYNDSFYGDLSCANNNYFTLLEDELSGIIKDVKGSNQTKELENELNEELKKEAEETFDQELKSKLELQLQTETENESEYRSRDEIEKIVQEKAETEMVNKLIASNKSCKVYYLISDEPKVYFAA